MKHRFQQPQPLSKGLTAHWKFWAGFTSSAKVFDYSLNGNTGTVSGALPSYPGFLFDGTDDKITAAADSDIDIKGKTALTISAWINPSSDGENDQGRIFDKGNSSTGYISWVSSEAGGKVTISFSVIMSGTNALAIKTAALSINTWQHLVFTFNEDGDKKCKIFVDGSELSLSTDTAGTGTVTNDSTDDLDIGNRVLSDSTFDGLIDDVMIFNIALSAEEVLSNYHLTRWRYGV